MNPAVSSDENGWPGFGKRTEEIEGVWSPGFGKRNGRGDSRGSARACERWFEWGGKEEVGRKMRTLVWRGEILNEAREKILVGGVRASAGNTVVATVANGKGNSASTAGKGRLTSYFNQASSSSVLASQQVGSNKKGKGRSPSPASRDYGAFPSAKLLSIHSSREHPSTGFILEYRVEYDPSEWTTTIQDAMDGSRVEPRMLTAEQRAELGMVSGSQYGLDTPASSASASEMSTGDEDSASITDTPRKKREKKEVDLFSTDKVWIPAVLVREVWPGLVEVYEEKLRAKAEKAATPKKMRVTKVKPAELAGTVGQRNLMQGWLKGKTKQMTSLEDDDDVGWSQKPTSRDRLRSSSPELEDEEVPEVPESPESRRTIMAEDLSRRSVATLRRYPTPPPQYAHIPYPTPSPELEPMKKKGARPPPSASSSSPAASDPETSRLGAKPTKSAADKPSPKKHPKIDVETGIVRKVRVPSPSPTPKTAHKPNGRRASVNQAPGKRLPMGRRNSDVIDITDSDEESEVLPASAAVSNNKPKHWAGKPKPLTQYFNSGDSRTKQAKKPAQSGHSSSTSYFEAKGKRAGHLASASSPGGLEDSDSSESDLEDPRELLSRLAAARMAAGVRSGGASGAIDLLGEDEAAGTRRG